VLIIELDIVVFFYHPPLVNISLLNKLPDLPCSHSYLSVNV